ncbi:hypothetical protein ACLOJK_036502 [Asimina triloba]
MERGIDKPPDCTLGWEARFCFARLTSERDIMGVPERWEESLPDPIPPSHLCLPAHQRWALMCLRGTTLRWHSSREEFFHWCESTHFAVDPVPLAKDGQALRLDHPRLGARGMAPSGGIGTVEPCVPTAVRMATVTGQPRSAGASLARPAYGSGSCLRGRGSPITSSVPQPF